MTEVQKSKREALRDLQDVLTKLRRDFDAATTNGKTDAQKRMAAFVSVEAVMDFMRGMPDWQGLDFGLLLLLEGLTEIEKGRTLSWLSNATEGANPIGERIAICRARLAGAVEFLIRTPQSREKAARGVSWTDCSSTQITPS